ncbi:MAG: bifunctional adenosylcobinamide kinase/adenosylcobinamide-phosphate guanylyltransferase [Microcystaceae cyanobacterium]
MAIILVTGAARSGKSDWAEKLATHQENQVIYLATAQIDPNDEEWQARITAHVLRRPPDWQTVHCPLLLADTLKESPQHSCLLVDSLGTWTANFLEQSEEEWGKMVEQLLITVKDIPNLMIFVAEETGWGVVPAYAMGRLFRDRLGSLTRRMGAIADHVYLVTGGYALDLTHLGEKID